MSASLVPLFHNELAEPAYAQRFILRVEEEVYTPGETLTIYGAAEPNDVLIVRLYDPAGIAVKIDNVQVSEDGFFREAIWSWPQPSINLAFGTYTLEVIPGTPGEDPQLVEIVFAESVQEEDVGLPRIPKTHTLGIVMDSPDQVTVNQQFRIFIQVTFDGALVAAEDLAVAELLGTSHVHSGTSTIILSDKFRRLHEGLYYADVTIDREGAYVIHAVAFYRGLLSHDSKVVTATVSSISTVQDAVTELDSRLDETNQELAGLQRGLDETKAALNDTKLTIRQEIENVQQASGQINSIILPVLALISVIIALQISLFARIRASYR
ncbi:MAG TPA: hypothetical protein VLA68_01385 [Nitrososphaera sp.]|nr:hypothetical protein [Nitrososphaera sp.]